MLIPKHYRALTTGKSDPAAIKAAVHFVTDIWKGCEQDAFTFIATRRNGRWQDHAISGDRASKTGAIIADHPAQRCDLYFCPSAFSEPRRLKPLALPTHWALCDIDYADPDGYDPQPSILWETSPNRFQGLWVCHMDYPARVAENISRNIRETFGGDKGGWSATKMLRIPGTINHKAEYQKPVVTLREFDDRPIKIPRSLRIAPKGRVATVTGAVNIDGLDHVEVMRRYRLRMGLVAGSLMTATRVTRDDRSGAVCLIVAKLIELGASDPEIAIILVNNVYFVDKYGNDPADAFAEISNIRKNLGVGR